jgi:hypothetical protein
MANFIWGVVLGAWVGFWAGYAYCIHLEIKQRWPEGKNATKL